MRLIRRVKFPMKLSNFSWEPPDVVEAIPTNNYNPIEATYQLQPLNYKLLTPIELPIQLQIELRFVPNWNCYSIPISNNSN
jgi:hypothetical protein